MSGLFDPETGEMAEPEGGAAEDCGTCAGLRAVTETMAQDVKGLERELRNQRRKVAALEAELREQVMDAPEMVTVKTLFAKWVTDCGRNPKTTKLGEKRTKTVLARLREGHAPERIMRAIEGAALAANTSPQATERLALIAALKVATDLLEPGQAAEVRAVYKRQAATCQRFDDLELICRDEVHLERFAALADRLAPVAPTLAV